MIFLVIKTNYFLLFLLGYEFGVIHHNAVPGFMAIEQAEEEFVTSIQRIMADVVCANIISKTVSSISILKLFTTNENLEYSLKYPKD